mgnify:CR=1 FL=1
MASRHFDERRRFNRIEVEAAYTAVRVQRVSRMKMQVLDGHAYDLSEGGLRLETDEPLAPGEHVALSVDLPGERSVFASGRVVRVFDADEDPGPRRAAIEFRHFLTGQDRSRLQGYLRQSATRRAA